jgi:hypothetical protein
MAVGFGRRSLRGSAFHGGAMERGGPYWFPGSAWEPTALQAPPAVLFPLLHAHGCKSAWCVAVEVGRRSLRGSAFHGGAMERGGRTRRPRSVKGSTGSQALPGNPLPSRLRLPSCFSCCMLMDAGPRGAWRLRSGGGASEAVRSMAEPWNAWMHRSCYSLPSINSLASLNSISAISRSKSPFLPGSSLRRVMSFEASSRAVFASSGLPS